MHFRRLLHIIDEGFSERFQPSDEIGIAPPLGGELDSFELRFCFAYSLTSGFQINGKVLVCSVHAGVSEPMSDGGKVDA
jgi:hypothetical protein